MGTGIGTGASITGGNGGTVTIAEVEATGRCAPTPPITINVPSTIIEADFCATSALRRVCLRDSGLPRVLLEEGEEGEAGGVDNCEGPEPGLPFILALIVE